MNKNTKIHTYKKKSKRYYSIFLYFFFHLNMEFNTQTQTMNNDLNNEQFQQPNDKNQKT